VGIITTAQAALRLGISENQVLNLIRSGRLKAELVGSQWLIYTEDLTEVRDKPDQSDERRPKKPKDR
jgi:excisionase family DNA binding protein